MTSYHLVGAVKRKYDEILDENNATADDDSDPFVNDELSLVRMDLMEKVA